MERSLTTDTIDLTPFPELYTEENIIVHKIFKKYGFDLRIAGGAVRDILLGISPHDIDFATNATPPQMHEMFSILYVENLDKRLRLSNLDLTILLYILNKRDYYLNLSNENDKNEMRFYEKEYLLSFEPSKIKPAITEMLKYLGKDKLFIDKWLLWQSPKFPVSGTLLIDQWDIRDKLMRPVLFKLREQWCESDYKLSADELLTESNKQFILDQLNNHSMNVFFFQENFEVTTLRVDVVTDGRHSEVVFTNNWKLDAERRDLTVNSMFLEVDMQGLFDEFNEATTDSSANENNTNNKRRVLGHLLDYFNGRDDLKNHRIRFVGDPDARIKEDYLRILRYFRFHGRLLTEDTYDKHDEDVLKIIASNANGLSMISGERCLSELKRILLYPSTPFLLRRMADAGLFVHLGLPENPNFKELDIIWNKGILSSAPNPITCLAAIMTSPDEVSSVIFETNKRGYGIAPTGALFSMCIHIYRKCHLSRLHFLSSDEIIRKHAYFNVLVCFLEVNRQ
ncbi:putative homeobox protein [Schistosoma mansoni]|uniref:putative homeobox protein n=1 Tax=Schistosoma mansoni TaxID=6183 RepID=UPI00022DC357|nr:putative homeobox protein [Schistosoma mansoni]|eukprot:XP_018650972.1 putative homeobox protein [Schistosoma mansoni]